ncbi:hypothetical protein CCACVL1_18351 [Corchorus capsularis]|uniref:RNase H type-1 domain-containing protein n=1 Tax=Corchorus capsularis TaxID=210143 RepID=A0A1R3HLS1_COCAP|nr:hypothetical protein CCACVL1_18351 [Corchorus capsularis]
MQISDQDGTSSNMAAELHALRMGLTVAWQEGFRQVERDIDAEVILELLDSKREFVLKLSEGRWMPKPRFSPFRSLSVQGCRVYQSGEGNPPRGKGTNFQLIRYWDTKKLREKKIVPEKSFRIDFKRESKTDLEIMMRFGVGSRFRRGGLRWLTTEEKKSQLVFLWAYRDLKEHIGAKEDQGDVIDASLEEHGDGSTSDRPHDLEMTDHHRLRDSEMPGHHRPRDMDMSGHNRPSLGAPTGHNRPSIGPSGQDRPFDPLAIPQGPMTRARAKRFKEALLGFVRSHLGG